MGHRIKKFNELTDELQKTIKEAKDKLLNAILTDTEISKVEKLCLISENDLFKTNSWICDPFHDEYFKEYESQLAKKGVTNPCIDSWVHNRDLQRHETVNLAEILEYMDEDDDDNDELITIYTNRRTSDTLKISKYEFVDTIYDWCIKNKCIAFEIDWSPYGQKCLWRGCVNKINRNF